jgi:hypothetical protein
MNDLLDWSVVILPVVLSTWPLLISVENTLKEHPWMWRVSLVLLGIALAILTRAQQRRTDTEHLAEMDLVQSKLDSTKGQLSLVADTLGEYKKCEGIPEMASAIKRIVAAFPARANAPVIGEGPISASPTDHSLSQYEHLTNDQLIAAAKVIADQISDFPGAWRYKVKDTNASYDERTYYKSPPPSGDERRRLEDARMNDLNLVDEQYLQKGKTLFISADDIRGVLVDRLSKKTDRQLPMDSTNDALFKRLAVEGPNAALGPNQMTYRDCQGASQYLLELCKRLGEVK